MFDLVLLSERTKLLNNLLVKINYRRIRKSLLKSEKILWLEKDNLTFFFDTIVACFWLVGCELRFSGRSILFPPPFL